MSSNREIISYRDLIKQMLPAKCEYRFYEYVTCIDAIIVNDNNKLLFRAVGEKTNSTEEDLCKALLNNLIIYGLIKSEETLTNQRDMDQIQASLIKIDTMIETQKNKNLPKQEPKHWLPDNEAQMEHEQNVVKDSKGCLYTIIAALILVASMLIFSSCIVEDRVDVNCKYPGGIVYGVYGTQDRPIYDIYFHGYIYSYVKAYQIQSGYCVGDTINMPCINWKKR